MRYEHASVSERRTLPPAIAVSAVAFAVAPPADAHIGDPHHRSATHGGVPHNSTPHSAQPSSAAGSAQDPVETTLWIPLVRRTREPFSGLWALPGGPTEWHETLSDTALRALTSSVLREPGYLEQLYAFGGVERSARAQRLVTIAYWAQYGERDLEAPAAGPAPAETAPSAPARWDDPIPQHHTETRGPAQTPDENVAWFSADRLPDLAFDHAEIIEYALWRLRVKTEYSAVAHRFLGPEFTLAELRRVHEAILGHTVDPANFRRQSLASGHLVDTGELLTGTAHRPARLYRFTDSPEAERGPAHPRRSMQ